MTAVVNLDHLVDILTKGDRFKDKYLLVFADEYANLIPWDSQDHLTRKTLVQQAEMVLTSNPSTIEWCLGRPPFVGGPEAFAKEFKTLKPCIHGSEPHELARIGHPCAKAGEKDHVCAPGSDQCELRYGWIKADPAFEGLRQLLYEPSERIRIQPEDPTPTKSIYCLADIAVPATVINQELEMAAVDMPLNAGLVAVTGGRGSGKTALVDAVAHCFVDRQHTADRNSFIRRIADNAPDLPISIEFSGGDAFTKTLSDGHFFEDSAIAYIAQGELERYIDEHSDLNEYIHNLVFESPAIKDSTDAFEYESLVHSTDNLQADADAKNTFIDQLERATASDVVDNLTKAGKQAKAQMEDLKKRITEAESKLSAEKRDLTKQEQEVVAKLKTQKDDLVVARDLLREAIRALDLDFARVVQTIQKLNAIVPERELPGGMVAHEVEYPAGQLVVMDSSVTR